MSTDNTYFRGETRKNIYRDTLLIWNFTSITFHKIWSTLFVKANTWLQITLSSPSKITLDQSMVFHKVLPKQRQTLRLSVPYMG